MDNSPILFWGLQDPDPFGLAGMAENMDMGEVKPSHIDTHKQGGVLLVVGAATALAKGTASVKPTGEAEIAMAAKSKALAPWTQGKTRHEVKIPL